MIFYFMYISSHDILDLITFMQLVLLVLYTTMGQAEDTLVVKDIVHSNSYAISVIHTVHHNGQG